MFYLALISVTFVHFVLLARNIFVLTCTSDCLNMVFLVSSESVLLMFDKLFVHASNLTWVGGMLAPNNKKKPSIFIISHIWLVLIVLSFEKLAFSMICHKTALNINKTHKKALEF